MAATATTLGRPAVRRTFVPPWVRRLSRNKLALAGGAVVLLVALAALFAPLISPHSPYQQYTADQLVGPSSTYPLGTDELGRDVFSRVLYGARISIQVAAISVAIGLLVGGSLGLLAAYHGGAWDLVIMRFADVLFAFPSLLLAIAVLALLGPSLANVMVAIGIIFVPIFVRVIRAAGLVIVQEQYVEASRAGGAGAVRIMLRHVLPNALPPLLVQTTLAISYAILSEASLSFLGLGAQPPEPSWGSMLSSGRGFMTFAPWTAFAPGTAIFVAVLGFNILGDGLRDVLDPRMKL
ncbi:MAG: ABC transporter, permease protein 2 (cluster 5, nickel/peptides/opines) [uncultured Thermomicrobiales bacterium]|jgi:peptide/nickel transport system permease protein|uniref:ABC transporter, permease protein 2 (Cluster 5, nickel/peptides/opines) n=1 Tax=uncultured Thermomicrobiales bacterium TaxID=1645740 RepID=A0A6J4VPU8_9BACT|nr:MAG: ABC transporter, permease protein 2 (cluster 5, nickel/peptides/opines) [uncultured Thermomicrobiales bacterium]